MELLAFELLKTRLGYYDPISVIDKNGTRKGQFLVMHDKDRNTFGFLNADTGKHEILSIEETEIIPL